MLAPYVPYPLYSGGRVRTFNLLKSLRVADPEIVVDLICYVKQSEKKTMIAEQHLRQFCASVNFVARAEGPKEKDFVRLIWTNRRCLYSLIYVTTQMQSAIVNALTKEKYDLIHVITFYMAGNLPKKVDLLILLEEQSVEFEGSRLHAPQINGYLLRLSFYLDTIKQQFEETESWRLANLITAVSKYDVASITNRLPISLVREVPNGVDASYFGNSSTTEYLDPTIFFIGNYRYFPNVDAALVLANKIFPSVKKEIPSAKLILAGADTPDIMLQLAGKHGIEVKGYVADYRSLLSQAWLFVAPIRSGGGTRLKILEAMAMGKTVITTSIGARGLSVINSKDILVEDDVVKIIDLIKNVIGNKEMRRKIGEQGRCYVIAQHPWRYAAERLFDCYKELVNETRNQII